MTHKRILQLTAAAILGIGMGAAIASQSTTNLPTTDDSNSTNALFDTSGVCVSDYCGCFEDLSRSRMLTDSARRREATH